MPAHVDGLVAEGQGGGLLHDVDEKSDKVVDDLLAFLLVGELEGVVEEEVGLPLVKVRVEYLQMTWQVVQFYTYSIQCLNDKSFRIIKLISMRDMQRIRTEH